MAVTNDGNGNYFTGNQLGGVIESVLKTDVQSMLTTLGYNFAFGSECCISIRPSEDALTGAIGTPNSFLNVADQARYQILVGSHSSASSSLSYVSINNSNNDTELSAYQTTNPYTMNHTRAGIWNGYEKCWAVANDKSVSYFAYTDTGNYILVSAGKLDNPNFYTYPDTIYGFYTGRFYDQAYTKYFISHKTNDSNGQSIIKGGALNNNTNSANYQLTQNSGMLLYRRTDNDYAIGNVPNLVVIKHQTGYALNKIINLNNITQGNQNILGSTENFFKLAGRLDSTIADDNAGYWIGMRIKKV